MRNLGVAPTLVSLSLALAACANSASITPSPSANDEPSATASASVEEPTPEPTPEATPEPTYPWYVEQLTFAPYGPMATVLVDDLRARMRPGVHAYRLGTLSKGQRIFVAGGPVTLDGYDWYNIAFEGEPGDMMPDGFAVAWVAGRPAAASAGSADWFIDIGQAACPPTDPVDPRLLGKVSNWVMDHCRITGGTIKGTIDTCFEGVLTPFDYEPEWAWFSCVSVSNGDIGFALQFPPEFDGPKPERGDVVTVTAHIGLDNEKYGPCSVELYNKEVAAESLESERHWWAYECQHRFIVSKVKITDHVDMPDYY